MKVLGCPTFLASAKEKEATQTRKRDIKFEPMEQNQSKPVHPVCLFVPHTKLFPSSSQVGSFTHIARVVDLLSATH
jgi:hypothetical protein